VLALFFQSALKFTTPYSSQELVFSTLTNLLFLGQSWNIKAWVFNNQPYWSLCYEVMYYLGFGVFVFGRGWGKWLGLLIVGLVSGPKVLLLLPCWVLGVLAYRFRDRIPLKVVPACILGFLLPVIVLVVLNRLGFGGAARSVMQDIWGDQKSYLEFSNEFPIDYVTASLVAINLYAARYIKLPFLQYFRRVIVWAASFSFTLYLMHLPLMFLTMNGMAPQNHTAVSFLAGAIGIPAVCYLISLATEQKRPALLRVMDRYLSKRTHPFELQGK
ncbi:MAG: hypothetical protein ABIZ09_09145, partial [Rhodoferax sp.]